MKVYKPEKFKDSKVSKRISASAKDISRLRHERWEELFKLYGCDPLRMAASRKGNPWAVLCEQIVLDVFPGFHRAKKERRPKLRSDEYNVHIFEMYSAVSEYSDLKADAIYEEIARFEEKRLGRPVTAGMVSNAIKKGRTLSSKKKSDPDALNNIFTASLNGEQAHNAKDYLNFFYSMMSIENKTKKLPGVPDTRNRRIYSAPLGRRKNRSY